MHEKKKKETIPTLYFFSFFNALATFFDLILSHDILCVRNPISIFTLFACHTALAMRLCVLLYVNSNSFALFSTLYYRSFIKYASFDRTKAMFGVYAMLFL